MLASYYESLLARYDPLLSRRGWMVVLTKTRGFLFLCGPSPCVLSICSWDFYFCNVRSLKPLMFDFAVSWPRPPSTAWGCVSRVGLLIYLRSLAWLIGSSLALPGIHSISLISFVCWPCWSLCLYRNLLPIDSRLNKINPSTNIILLPNAKRGNRIKLEILLGGVFKYIIE